jgi:hypothetical protein
MVWMHGLHTLKDFFNHISSFKLTVEIYSSSIIVAANILNKQSRTADSGWSSSLGVGRGANNPSP